MFKNFENFIDSSKENFPEKECIIQNKRESNVFDGDHRYLVLCINTSFPAEKFVKYATPYICKEDNGRITYGWSTENNEVFGNVENSCQLWDEFVVGFMPIDEDYIETDKKLFEGYKKKIDEQWE